MRRARGFTLIELAVVLTVSALVVPLAFASHRELEGQLMRAQWNLDVAEAVRTLSEQLALDGRAGLLERGDALRFVIPGCGPVLWEATAEGRLLRQAPTDCGGPLGLASGVESLRRVDGGLELVFALAVRPDFTVRRTVLLPLAPKAKR